MFGPFDTYSSYGPDYGPRKVPLEGLRIYRRNGRVDTHKNYSLWFDDATVYRGICDNRNIMKKLFDPLYKKAMDEVEDSLNLKRQ